MTYAEQLLDPRWQKKRLEIFHRDNFTCQLCEDAETELQVHHIDYKGFAWEAPNDKLTTLCKHCHKLVEFLIKGKNKLIILSVVKIKQDDDTLKMITVYQIEGNKKDAALFRIYQNEITMIFKNHLEVCNNILKINNSNG